MDRIIKNCIKGSSLYFFHLAHSENEFMNDLMNKSFTIDYNVYRPSSYNERLNQESYAHYISYLDIIKSNQLYILYDIVPNTNYRELEILGTVAVNENNKDIIQLLYENGLQYDFIIYDHSKGQIPIIAYAYYKHGLELVKFIGDLDIKFIKGAFDYCTGYDDSAVLDYLVENNQSLDNIFLNTLRSDNDTKTVLDTFVDKVDITKCQNMITDILSNKLDIIKILPDYGIPLDFDRLFTNACRRNNPEVIEFCLENGLEIKKDHLLAIIRDCMISTYYTNFPLYKHVLILLMKYNVDFSILEFGQTIDYEFLSNLENHGFDKDAFVNYCMKN